VDYSADPWWSFVIVIGGFFALIIGLPILSMVASARRARRQSVVLENGVVHITDSAFGRPKAIRADRIGTVVYLAERESSAAGAPITSMPLAASDSAAGQDYRNTQARATGNGTNMFRFGGLIILNTTGRMIAHVAYEVGSHAPMGTVWKQIPAPNHVQFAETNGNDYSRRAFKKAFPKALRFGQMWGTARWVWTILGVVFLGLPVLGFIALCVVVWVQMYG